MRVHWIGIVALVSQSAGSLFAQGGAIPIRIPDGAKSACVDAGKDQIYLTLRRVIATKKGNWFTEDKSTAVVITATVRKSQGDPISFPLMTEATLQGYAKGQVSVPIEYAIVSEFPLKQKDAQYGALQLEMTFLNKRGTTSWGNLMQSLADTAKNLPLPNVPAVSSAKYILDFANTAVKRQIDATKDQEKLKTAALALNFDPNGKCDARTPSGSEFERTGTVAILQAEGTDGNLIDIRRVDEYCWTADLRPAFLLKTALKEGNKACDASDYKPTYKQVTNNYIGFFLNAVRAPEHLGALDNELRTAALQRCRANGVPDEKCLPN